MFTHRLEYLSSNIFSIPVASFTAGNACVNEAIAFNDQSFISQGNITNWSWSFGDNSFSTSQNNSHAYASAGNFLVTLTVTSNNGCSTAATSNATAYPLPVADFSFSPNPIAQITDEIQFKNYSSGATQWFWNFGDGNSSAVQSPSHLYADTGNFIITLITISPFGCRDTTLQNLRVEQYAFYVPNAFTPNHDGLNDIFISKGMDIAQFNMKIFDRWGNMIFETNDLKKGWDGRANKGNEITQEDVYIWKVEIVGESGRNYNYMGNVNLVR